MNIVICGGRKFEDYALFDKEMKEILDGKSNFILVNGGAAGADTLASRYAQCYNYPYEVINADWDNLDVPGAVIKTHVKTGKPYNVKAGIDRNNQMLEIADMVVAFWDNKSRGTGHMVQECKRRNIPLVVVNYDNA